MKIILNGFIFIFLKSFFSFIFFFEVKQIEEGRNVESKCFYDSSITFFSMEKGR